MKWAQPAAAPTGVASSPATPESSGDATAANTVENCGSTSAA
jgi:hypothetical protein